MNGLPWTMHLEGMHNILHDRGLGHSHAQETPFRRHLIEVMGVMDLPTFSVGRQNACIGIWHRYCRGIGYGEEIESVSGLPRSLLDIIAGIGYGTVEEDFLNWPGEQGSFLQCYLWEAHRLAGILALRRFEGRPGGNVRRSRSGSPHNPATPPKTGVLVTQALANLDAIRRGCAGPGTSHGLIMNAVNYPLFFAGLELSTLDQHNEWKELIRNFYCDNGERRDRERRDGAQYQLLLKLLGEFWRRNDSAMDVNGLAGDMGMELGLL